MERRNSLLLSLLNHELMAHVSIQGYQNVLSTGALSVFAGTMVQEVSQVPDSVIDRIKALLLLAPFTPR